MNVINFPVAAQNRPHRNSVKLNLTRPDVVHNKLHLGPWTFECTRCDAPTVFESQGMVFRKLEFYCSSCGVLHQVTNPAFTPSPAPKNK